MRVVEEKTELGRAKFRHKEEGVMPRDKVLSETDEARFRAVNKNVGRSETVTTMGAGGVITCARAKAIRIVSMESMTRDQLETSRLKIT